MQDISPQGGDPLFFPSAEGKRFRRYSGAPLEARFTLKVSVDIGRLRRPGGLSVPTDRGKGDRTPSMVSCPLLTPHLPFEPSHRRCSAKLGLRGLGSVRRADFGTLLCPEFSLRKAPRITVRGQTVQSVRLVLRKAPLRSRVCPWAANAPVGPSHLDARPKGVAS